MSACWDIYEQELYRLSYGLPIWQAEPFSIEQEIHIGDVGYMNEGRFIRVFNVFYGDTSSNANVQQQPEGIFLPRIFPGPFPNDQGVPPGHIPLAMRTNNIQTYGTLPIKPYSTERYSMTEVSPHIGADSSAPIAGTGMKFEFSTRRRRVAALFLRELGEIKRPRGEEPFGTYSQDRWRSWREFTRNTIHGFHAAEKLMFVYGHTKTKAWTSVAFEQSRSAGSISFNVTIPAIGSGGLTLSHGNSTSVSPHINSGPQRLYIYEDDHEDDHGDGDRPLVSGDGGIQMITQDENNPQVQYSNRAPVKRDQTVFLLRLTESDRPRVMRMIDILASLKQLLGRSTQSTSSDAANNTNSPGKEGAASSASTSPSQHSTPGKTRVSPTIAALAATDINLLLSRGEDTFGDIVSGFHIDPLDFLLIYVLEIESSARRAVVSDDDMNSLFLAYISRHKELTDNIAQVLHELKPSTYTDATGVGHIAFYHPNPIYGPKTTAITPRVLPPTVKTTEVSHRTWSSQTSHGRSKGFKHQTHSVFKLENIEDIKPKIEQDDLFAKSLVGNGFISHSFGSHAAEILFTPLLKTKILGNLTPTYVAKTRHPHWIRSSPDTILDFEVPNSARSSVVPQRLGGHPSETSTYPIFFYSRDSFGITLQAAMEGALGGLLNCEKPVSFGGRHTINLCIRLHGYAEFSRQIATTETLQRSTMTHEKLLRAVARTVSWFLQHPPEQTPESSSDRRWPIGPGGITEDLIIIGLVQVSEGSWQPILRLP